MNNIQIAERIKLVCKQKNYSLQKVLAVCGLNKGFIYDLEKKGSIPSADKFFKLADYLHVSVDYLLGRTDLPEQSELTAGEEKLLANNRELNDTGQEKLLEYSEDLVDSGKYERDEIADAVGDYKLIAFGGDNKSYEEDTPQII